MSEEEILKQEEEDRKRKEDWANNHPILHFFHKLKLSLGRMPPDD